MARRTVLTSRQRSVLFSLPQHEADLLRHYTLSEEDLQNIGARRRPRNKLGFALQLCVLRYPGRLLAQGEFVPPTVVDFIGHQLDLDGDELADYAVRSETRHEHLAELRRLYGFRSFSGGAARELGDRLREEAQRAQSNEDLVRRFVDACRRTRTILPATTTIERLCADALVDAERWIEARIAERVPPALRHDLEHLLDETVDAGVTRFVCICGASIFRRASSTMSPRIGSRGCAGRTYREAARTCEALDAVIADGPGWEGLGDLVAMAAALANKAASDPLNHVLAGYSRFRRYTPRMLRTLDIEASPVAQPLLEAVDVLRSDATARPTGFLRPNSKWSRLLRTQPDHRLWETAVLFHLRDAFRAGDVWLARSRRYGDIRKTLLSAPVVADADRSLPVPVNPHDWLAERRFALDEGLHRQRRHGASRCDHWRQNRRRHAPHRKDGSRRAGRGR